jgi:hypothetical protein
VLLDHEYELCITAPGSKSRQYGPAPSIRVAGMRGHPQDPVQAWLEHVRMNELRGRQLGLYQAFSYNGLQCRLRMLHSDLVNAAKDMAGLLGLSRDTVAGHSFRRGGASFAYQACVPDTLIQRQRDWISCCYREYITLSREVSLSATHDVASSTGACRHAPVCCTAVGGSPYGTHACS